MAFTVSSNAASFSYTAYTPGDETYSELLSKCGSSSDVGYSSVFGSSESYESNFPIMGQFHSEIETMPAISSSSSASAYTIFYEAEIAKNNLYGYSYDIAAMMNRNSDSISVTEEIYDSTMDTYQESADQIQSESDYVTDTAITDALDVMSTNISSSEDYSDYQVWSTCLGWWVSGMPFYLTDSEVDAHTVRLNGWSDGELTNSVYAYPSTSISQIVISDGTYSYDRSAYNDYVGSDDDSSLSDTSEAETTTDSSSDQWWEDGYSSDTTTDDSESVNWWD
ncbi:hypothetical protein [Psychromonas sp. SP041]|uniref:hypothetical protein n=1 Tax=Psychromonas sp. SP041 TaxID=1365007 RepID=UPI0010C7A129|nr:hypothetical protein [Psychromonas sp. SP041]